MSFSRSYCALVVVFVLLTGCEEDAQVDVPEGRYQVYVDGSIVDTLSGPAVYRALEGGGIGIELGTPTGPGLSIEISNESLGARTYEIVPAELLESARTDTLSGMMAFLSIRKSSFEATQGQLMLTHVGEGEVRGTLYVDMKGRGAPGSGELSVRVRGELRAVRK